MSNQKTKQELVALIATQAGVSTDTAKKVLDSTLATVRDELVAGNDVAFKDFGTFKVKHQKERQGRNPKTGESLIIKAQKGVSFKIGKGLKERLND